ncbi:hypothetical protein SHAb15599_00144 [Acinetobacter phage SH-Ab 15599]|nr:hypothetical protein SHAb15599_00144 [Acinetobacter phage SH-Ab 15599]
MSMNNLLSELGIIPAGSDTNLGDVSPDERPQREDFELEIKPSNAPDIEDSDAKPDLSFARSAIHALITMNLEITHRASTVAKETEHPRAIEAFNSASSNALNSVKELVSLHSNMKTIYKDAKVVPKTPPEEAEEGTTINIAKTVAVNTSELLRLADEAEAERNSQGGNS